MTFLQPGVPNAYGTRTIRRRFTNTTQQTITRLRFRIVDITTLNTPGYTPNGAQADLRLINSSTSPLNPPPAGSPAVAVPEVLGTSLEQPPTQTNGGG